MARTIRRLTERQLNDGYQLVNKINSTREKLLVGADQVICHIVYDYSYNISVLARVHNARSNGAYYVLLVFNGTYYVLLVFNGASCTLGVRLAPILLT